MVHCLGPGSLIWGMSDQFCANRILGRRREARTSCLNSILWNYVALTREDVESTRRSLLIGCRLRKIHLRRRIGCPEGTCLACAATPANTPSRPVVGRNPIGLRKSDGYDIPLSLTLTGTSSRVRPTSPPRRALRFLGVRPTESPRFCVATTTKRQIPVAPSASLDTGLGFLGASKLPASVALLLEAIR